MTNYLTYESGLKMKSRYDIREQSEFLYKNVMKDENSSMGKRANEQ